MFIEILDIDDTILDKIESKHGVAFEEAAEVCESGEHHARRGREGFYEIYGRTDAGRYLLVVLAYRGSGRWNVVTARDMTQQERRLYRRMRGL